MLPLQLKWHKYMYVSLPMSLRVTTDAFIIMFQIILKNLSRNTLVDLGRALVHDTACYE